MATPATPVPTPLIRKCVALKLEVAYELSSTLNYQILSTWYNYNYPALHMRAAGLRVCLSMYVCIAREVQSTVSATPHTRDRMNRRDK